MKNSDKIAMILGWLVGLAIRDQLRISTIDAELIDGVLYIRNANIIKHKIDSYKNVGCTLI